MSAVLYARAGEDIVCDAGHVVTRPTRDLRLSEKIFGPDLEGMAHLRPPAPDEGREGDPLPSCACGAHWNWHGIFRFREGYRVFANGIPQHLTLDEVVFGWPDGVPDPFAEGFWA